MLDLNKYEFELFGEEKNNGSISYGALEKANQGTLLIDQVSEIPLAIQSKILRVLIDQKFKRLNGNNDINVDVRLICSSSKDLKEEIKIGNFREDLYHRLNVFEINIKSLNEIPLGHKIAMIDFKEGDTIIKYGHDIGKVVKSIKKGEHVHVHNVKTKKW